jgi:hypothetical protein
VISILKRNLRLDDEDLVSRIYDYHKQTETPDGRIEVALMAEVIRDTRQSEGVTKEIAATQVFDFSHLPHRQ